MKLRQLNYFVALAQSGTFSEAAKDAHVSQPALSQQVKKLEEELGTPLFERMSNGVKLTDAGEQFLPRAIDILDRVRETRSTIQSRANQGASGSLKIGIIPTIAPYLLPDLMNEIHGGNQEVDIYIEEQQTDVLIDRLKTGSVDHLILSPPIPRKGFNVRTVAEEPFLLAVSNEDPLSDKDSVTVPDIKDEPMLLLEEGHCLRDQSLQFCRREDIDPQIVFQGSSLQSILNLVSTDFGYTFVPEMVVDNEPLNDVSFVEITNPTPTREIILVRRQSTSPTAPDELFTSSVENVLEQ